MSKLALACSLAVGLGNAATAVAQTDEIQVYDGGLAAPGVFNLTLHNNVVVSGLETPAFPGGVTADKSWNGVPEWAVGITKWFEAGLYLPLYSHDQELGWGLNGVKLRTLFAAPNAGQRRFVYGANFEFSLNAKRWDAARFTSEIRPIVGWRAKRVEVYLNPILDTSYDGFKNLDFAPCLRVALNLGRAWAVAVEEYADLGPLRGFHALADQSHQLYAVVDHRGALELEAGVGIGLTDASDPLTFKLILSYDLNARKPLRHAHSVR